MNSTLIFWFLEKKKPGKKPGSESVKLYMLIY
jgi:hypothetical protein